MSVWQGFGKEATDINELKSLLMKDLYKNSQKVLRAQSRQIDSLKQEINHYRSYSRLTQELMPEMKVLFPYVEEASCSHTYLMHADTLRSDTVVLVYLKSKVRMSDADKKKF